MIRAYPKTHRAMTWRVLPCPQGARRGPIPAAVLASSKEHRGRAEDAVPAAGGLSFHAGRRYLFGGKTALGIPARTAALPGAKTQAIRGQWVFGQALI
jgi:hypothetical protein